MTNITVDKDLIEHVAKLARLKLSFDEIEKFSVQLKEVIEMFSELEELDLDDVKPSFQPIEIKNSLRDDIPKPCLTQEQALLLTEHKEDGFFKGPKAI